MKLRLGCLRLGAGRVGPMGQEGTGAGQKYKRPDGLGTCSLSISMLPAPCSVPLPGSALLHFVPTLSPPLARPLTSRLRSASQTPLTCAWCLHPLSFATHHLAPQLSPSPRCFCACPVASVVSDPLRPRGMESTRLLCPRDSPGKNIREWAAIPCSRGIFPTQGLNLCL